MLKKFYVVFILSLSLALPLLAAEIKTNAVTIKQAPDWLKRVRVEKVTDRIQSQLEWTIRRIEVHWYKDQPAFNKVHSRGSQVQAFARREDNSIHIGPKVNAENFDQVFGHELSHIISYQKYKGSIPSWLEEGMANHVAKKGKVDYKWLAKQAFPKDVRKLSHPFNATSSNARYHYAASQALVEMLDKKCNLQVLLQLSVERKMEDYIKTYCEIKDLNAAYKDWVTQKAK